MTPRVGVDVRGPDAAAILGQVQELEARGIHAAWLTMGIPAYDPVTLQAIVAARTQRIALGTSIIPAWTRHPLVAAQQARTIDAIAPGRFRLGVGTSHRQAMESTAGVTWQRPLGYLAEWMRIVRALLAGEPVDVQDRALTARATFPAASAVPVYAAALRPASWRTAAAAGDGGISWVCPQDYLARVARPAMDDARRASGREGQARLIAHVPVAETPDRDAARAAVRDQLGFYPRAPFYQAMFAEAGFPEASAGTWSDAMVDAVAVTGGAGEVRERLLQALATYADEVLVTVVTVGNPASSRQAVLDVLAEVAQEVGT